METQAFFTPEEKKPLYVLGERGHIEDEIPHEADRSPRMLREG